MKIHRGVSSLILRSVFAGLLGVAVITTGCATSQGNQVDVSDTSSIVDGKTTKSELISKFGQPTQTTRDSKGKQTLVWLHTKSTIHAATYIPVVGMFAGGATTENKTLTVFIDRRGIVQGHEYSDATISSKLNGN